MRGAIGGRTFARVDVEAAVEAARAARDEARRAFEGRGRDAAGRERDRDDAERGRRARVSGVSSCRDAFESRRRREEEKRFDPRARARRAANAVATKTSRRDEDDDDDDHCGASTLDEYERAWCAFERRAMRGARIAFDDVPWPRSGAWLLCQSLAKAGDDRDAIKRAHRAFFVRWHPDKFTQRFGRAFVERDRDRIIARASATFVSARVDVSMSQY
jgi:hypothetical protein